MSDTKPRRFDLKQAREIALEYAEPGSMIDNGNLFFALGEFMESHAALEARIAELEEELTLKNSNSELKEDT